MKKTILTFAMAALCLNFCLAQDKQKASSSVNQPYKFDFSGFKSGYKSGYRITDDEFMKGKSITVRNYTITQLFALALGAGKHGIPADHIIIDVREPGKLNQLKCYQLVVPFYLTDNFYIIMQQSLHEEFPEYIVKMERRGTEYFMLIIDKEL